MATKRLYDSNSTMYVLSALLRQPTLLHEGKYLLTEVDFQGLHKIIFSAIFNLSAMGNIKIGPEDVDLYLKQYTTQYEVYKKENGLDYCRSIFSLSDEVFEQGKFDYYYERMKKFTILRDFDRNGIDIKQFYNPDADFTQIDKENEKLNNTPIQDLFMNVHKKLSLIEERNTNKDSIKAINAGFGLRDLLKELEKSPEIGLPLEGEMLNFASRGARLGKLYLYSAPTGHGKTRFLVGNACAMSLPRIENGVPKHIAEPTNVLFIATEMDPEEIQTLVLAYVSGVDEEKILNGKASEEEKRLLEMGVRIIEQNSDRFRIEKISDPDIDSIRTKIVNYILNDKYTHIFYDYIFTSTALNAQFQRTGLREDVVLMMMANGLKQIASDYDVFIYSGTQVNRGWEKAQFRNENTLAGSKAIADKADFGIVATRLTEEEKEKIGPLLKADGIGEMPNIVLDVYKNRRGRITNAKIFRVFDYATCRAKDLIVTDTNYNKWNLGMGRIQYKTGLLGTVLDNNE